MTDTCLRYDNLPLGYHGRAAVHHLSGVVNCGTLTAAVGANGSGKSPLMKVISGILTPIGGQCRSTAGWLTYLIQQSELDRSFPVRVIDLVSMGLWQRRGLFGRTMREDRADLTRCPEAVALSGFAARPLDSLSGGQMQRAVFSRPAILAS